MRAWWVGVVRRVGSPRLLVIRPGADIPLPVVVHILVCPNRIGAGWTLMDKIAGDARSAEHDIIPCPCQHTHRRGTGDLKPETSRTACGVFCSAVGIVVHCPGVD